jgi:hypothetical protein
MGMVCIRAARSSRMGLVPGNAEAELRRAFRWWD